MTVSRALQLQHPTPCLSSPPKQVTQGCHTRPLPLVPLKATNLGFPAAHHVTKCQSSMMVQSHSTVVASTQFVDVASHHPDF